MVHDSQFTVHDLQRERGEGGREAVKEGGRETERRREREREREGGRER